MLPNAGNNVLDLGTGTIAFYASEIVGSTGKITGIDISEGMLAHAKEKLVMSDANGCLCFHAFPETSFFWVSVARSVLAKHGFPYLLNTPTGSREATCKLLSDAGFTNVDIREEEAGYFVPLDKAKESWIQADDFAPGQYPHPVLNAPLDIMSKCRADYEDEIEKLNTTEGVWNDTTMYYIYASR